MKNYFINERLAALTAIAAEGSFEGAAWELGISTSAVSQRMRALETQLGRILVHRGSPCTLTADGQLLLRHAKAQALLAAELTAELDPSDREQSITELSVGINADSLATWFEPVLVTASRWHDVRLQLVSDDEGHTAALLRSGVVMAAVSTFDGVVAGCQSEPLGALTYLPLAHPELLKHHDVTSLPHVPQLPVVRFGAKDDLQDQALRAAGLPAGPKGPTVPSSEAFAAAVGAGLGWGMIPVMHANHYPQLVAVPGLQRIERKLYWHRWKLTSNALDRLTLAVRSSFQQHQASVSSA